MLLTPTELERWTIYTAAELARKELWSKDSFKDSFIVTE